MKTTVKRTLTTLLAAVLFLPVLGCGRTDDTPSPDSQDGTAENQTTGEYEEPTETEPDYSWFEMPEDTGKLTIYSPGNFYSSVLNPAVEIFKERYPEIEVSYEILSDDEFENRIRTEIPAGKGPDLVLLTDGTFPDVYKTMQSDVFEDLNPYFATDEEIALSDFVKPVMDAGVMHGKRVLAPLNYELSILMTTESILDELGMTAEELESIDGFIAGAERFRENYPDSTLFFDLGGVNPAVGDILTLYRIFGFDLIDYEKDEVGIDEVRYRQYIDLVKLYFNPDYDPQETEWSVWEIPYYDAGGGLHLKCFPYDDECGESYANYVNSRIFLNQDGEEPVLFTPKNQNGGVTAEPDLLMAIPKGASNKAAAWKLLKILLSEEIQGGHDENRWGNSYFWGGRPVRLSSTKPMLDHGAEMTPDGEEFDEFVALVQSPTDAVILPRIYSRYIQEHMLPYIRGEKSWEECWKSFRETVEIYKDE